MATPLNMLKTKTVLPYDYPLSHHQLMFCIFTIIYSANMRIFFSKCKQNDIFTTEPDNRN